MLDLHLGGSRRLAGPATVAGDEDEDMGRMTIGEFAQLAGLTPKALRLYGDMGLVVPAEVDPVTGYRLYAADQLGRARLVARLRLIGMPLPEIRHVVGLPADAAAAELTSYWRQVEADIRTRRARVLALVEQLGKEERDMSTHTYEADVAWQIEQGARDAQLDAIATSRNRWVVADGFGPDDAVASAALAAFLGGDFDGDPVPALDEAMGRAQAAVEALADGHPRGSTLTAAWLLGDQLAVAHIGDSRAWLLRDGELRQLTQDHTEVQSLLRNGLLTEDEARSDPRRTLLNRALAPGEPGDADIFLAPLQPGDRLMLTTDGTHGVLSVQQLADLLGVGSPQQCVDGIIAAVEDAGAPDNCTVVVADVSA